MEKVKIRFEDGHEDEIEYKSYSRLESEDGLMVVLVFNKLN